MILALAVSPIALEAQVSVYPVRDLEFGILSPGIATWVDPAGGAGQSARMDLVGQGKVTVEMDLPAALTSATGALLPLSFGATDGLLEITGTGQSTRFDPAVPITFQIPPGRGAAVIYLGGTAAPLPDQRPGRYNGTLIVRVSTPGT